MTARPFFAIGIALGFPRPDNMQFAARSIELRRFSKGRSIEISLSNEGPFSQAFSWSEQRRAVHQLSAIPARAIATRWRRHCHASNRRMSLAGVSVFVLCTYYVPLCGDLSGSTGVERCEIGLIVDGKPPKKFDSRRRV
jgi:hypothetical protein